MGAAGTKKANPSRMSSGGLTCPLCNRLVDNEVDLIEHYNTQHNGSVTQQQQDIAQNGFNAGDRVLAMWVRAMWQYFPATVVKKKSDDMYEINWDDGDTSGRIIAPENLYHNIVPPSETLIQVGSRVLFKQGSYSAGDTQLTGGERWHEGIVTDVDRRVSGVITFSGHHAKGPSDGKGTNYRGYNYTFSNLQRSDLRLSNSRSRNNNNNINNSSRTLHNNVSNRRTLKRDDHVLAMWDHARWQYFPAKIVAALANGRDYEVNWDDGDTEGRIVDSMNIYFNEQPEPTLIKIGSQVLFKQGYYGSMGLESGGSRWHEGVVTEVHTLPGGVRRFTGHHTKGVDEGKSVDYAGYHFKFERYSHQNLRLKELSDMSVTISESINSTVSYQRSCIDMSTKFHLEIGDRVIAEYKNHGRYFSATITDILSNSKYMLEWCDGDLAGREVLHYKLNLDSIPKYQDISIDTLIYFQQGTEWCPGLITKIHPPSVDHLEILYDGESLSDSERKFEGFTVDQLCSRIEVTDTGFLMLSSAESFVSALSPSNNPDVLSNHLNVGDRVLAMWVKTKWQYFPATIRKSLPNLQYKIEWDDGDSTGLIVDCFNIAKDVIPEPHNVGVGSVVLFQQGGYSGGDTQRTGGTRWHQGVITRVYQNTNNGQTVYDGRHTKDENDGKWCSYRGYASCFYGVSREDLRVGPNLFNLMTSGSELVQPGYQQLLLPSAPQYDTLDGDAPPPSYDDVIHLVSSTSGFMSRPDNINPASTVPPPYSLPSMSTATTENDRTVPYTSRSDNIANLLRDLDPLVKLMENTLKDKDRNLSEEDEDIFISYHWGDSHTASSEGQVSSFKGTEYSDARRIALNISEDSFLKTWLDVKSLSNQRNKSVYEQHALAIKRCRVFMAFVSDQYAASMFCRMQFQFACGFPDKTVIPIIVDCNDRDGATAIPSWKSSVIGMSLDVDKDRYQVFDLSNVDSDNKYRDMISQIMIAVNK